MNRGFSLVALLLAGVSGCGPSYSPDAHSATAAQQANKADRGIIVRPVRIGVTGALGTVTRAAAGGTDGAQGGAGPVSAFSSTPGGPLAGRLAGSALEHATADAPACEYIIRKTNGSLVSVTQKDKVPLTVGERVLVIAGNQARVVPDDTVAPPATPDRRSASGMIRQAAVARPR